MTETRHVEFAPVVDAKWLEDPVNWRRMKAAMYATSGIPVEALEAGALRDVVEVLEVIAARDTLFEANDAAFAPMVVRRMQEQAKVALRSLGRLE